MKTRRSIINIALNIHYVLSRFIKSLPDLGIAILAASVFQGCSKHACTQDSDFTGRPLDFPVKLAVHNLTDGSIKSIDALVFEDDILQRIDCYQRFENSGKEILHVGSCSGNKIIFICANPQCDKEGWRSADSFRKINQIKADLEKEERSHPLMSAEVRTSAGGEICKANLERLSSIVAVNSISCDFAGRPYEGETLTDVRIYLTNICGTCSITAQNTDRIERIINHGGLIAEDLKAFSDSSLVIRHIGDIDSERIMTDIELVCYPNTCIDENAGSSFTRLVIEGKIQGETWYWPININRESGGTGIERNTKYTYDIVITRKGSKDPDSPISWEMAEIKFEAERWNEKEEYHVGF